MNIIKSFLSDKKILLNFLENKTNFKHFEKLTKDLYSNKNIIFSNLCKDNPNWQCLYAYSGFGEEEINRLFELFKNVTIYGFGIDKNSFSDLCIITSPQAYWQFEFAYGIVTDYGIGIITTKNIDFVLFFCNSYDYCLLYGKQDFLENIINTDIDAYYKKKDWQYFSSSIYDINNIDYDNIDNKLHRYLIEMCQNKDFDTNRELFNKIFEG